VNIASLSTFVAFPETAAYAASKAAIGQLTRSLASEWARAGIRVNAVAPGFFLTDLNKPILEGTERGAQAIARTPLGRLGELDELVAPVIYLCSPGASFVTGVIIPVDGGLLATGF
jgi:NAD(P)-dependent dehydrogenase (short-subunit alcohol dehydrogenase family)